mmetsp:Transcript_1398/g.4993  ORF Transcript_1398/g.4993 Transcript_1398/m.4993 type:complete len:379 (-) Transcript_1398:1039-2175(-)
MAGGVHDRVLQEGDDQLVRLALRLGKVLLPELGDPVLEEDEHAQADAVLAFLALLHLLVREAGGAAEAHDNALQQLLRGHEVAVAAEEGGGERRDVPAAHVHEQLNQVVHRDALLRGCDVLVNRLRVGGPRQQQRVVDAGRDVRHARGNGAEDVLRHRGDGVLARGVHHGVVRLFVVDVVDLRMLRVRVRLRAPALRGRVNVLRARARATLRQHVAAVQRIHLHGIQLQAEAGLLLHRLRHLEVRHDHLHVSVVLLVVVVVLLLLRLCLRWAGRRAQPWASSRAQQRACSGAMQWAALRAARRAAARGGQACLLGCRAQLLHVGVRGDQKPPLDHVPQAGERLVADVEKVSALVELLQLGVLGLVLLDQLAVELLQRL